MRRYFVVRALSMVPTVVGVSIAVFLMIRLIPGTIVDQMIGTEGTYSAEATRALRAFFGLDQPMDRLVQPEEGPSSPTTSTTSA